MELYEQIFTDVMEFNDYVNMGLINDKLIITPICVIPTNGKLWIFYTKEQFY
jgi:hypothetical protein